MRGLNGSTALVTGATGVIGGAIARRLVDEGALVLVVSRSLEKAEAFIKREPGRAQRLRACALDLCDGDSISAALETLERAGTFPEVMIAAASVREGLGTPVRELSHAHFTRLFAADVAGHYLCARGIVERLAPGRAASFVWLSSIYADVGVDQRLYPSGMAPTPVTYAAAKAGVGGLVRYLAAAWGERGVRVNAVVSGGVQNPSRQLGDFVQRYAHRTMLGRMAQADEIAAVAVFLASAEASYITAQTVSADGGFTAW